MGLTVITLTLGPLQSNCYLAFDKGSRGAIIIDPGDAPDYILQEIGRRELKPLAIVATHGHFDHILAATHLMLALDIPFLMNKRDEFLLARMISSSKLATGVGEDLPPIITKYLKNGDKIKIGNSFFSVLATPGHTPGSVSLYSMKGSLVFVGDLVFSDGSIGRYDFRYSEKDNLLNSLRKILKLPSETKVYSGHGEDSSIGALRVLLKNSNFV